MTELDDREGRGRVETRRRTRVRLEPGERRRQIVAASAELIAQQGSTAVSLQQVADAVGITQPGLLHYVKNRDGLLAMVVEYFYDQVAQQDFGLPAMSEHAGLTSDGRLSFRGYFRWLVRINAERPQFVRLFVALSAEAIQIDHPAHEYFAHRNAMAIAKLGDADWGVPERFRSDTSFGALVAAVLAAMDGVQVRWLTAPGVGLVERWAEVEPILFPPAEWDGY